ncbi:ABC transporter ATP-binding protein [Aerococcaceae bacterium 50-4]
MQNENVIEMRDITKIFGAYKANDHINFNLKKGEVHALLGENGAGKSTLMNILSGLLSPTSGEILVNGQAAVIGSPEQANKLGIGMVHQHFMLIDKFTVAENIVLGKESTKFGYLDEKAAKEKIIELSNQYHLAVDPDAYVQDISVGQQQRVEIIKALYRGADILIFDEPTAVLTPQEIDELMQIMKAMTLEGKSIILITHKLDEITTVADRCTVIRRGQSIDTVDVAQTNKQALADMMVGRHVNFTVDKKPAKPGSVILQVEDLIVNESRGLQAVKSVDFDVRAGEVLGIAGIDGNGQTELIQAIAGLRKVVSGKVVLSGKDVTNKRPRKITEAGLGHIPEDRQKHGLFLELSIAENMAMQSYYKNPFSKNGLLNHRFIKDHAKTLIDEFDVRTESEDTLSGALSGGNQQKVIIARELDRNPDLLIAAQPTRGLDVGAIEFVHDRLVQHRDAGKSVLLMSFELDEIMGVSDRIAVMHDGEINAIVNADETNETELGLLMAGVSLEEARIQSALNPVGQDATMEGVETIESI